MDGPQDMVPPGRGSRCPALRRLVPVGFGAEARTLVVLSGPLFLFQMLNFMTYVVSSVFCGHLGKVELAAVTLSVAFVNVCGVSIGFGLSSACDTLMSQVGGPPRAWRGRASPSAAAETVGLGAHLRPRNVPWIWELVRPWAGAAVPGIPTPKGHVLQGPDPPLEKSPGSRGREPWRERQSPDLECEGPRTGPPALGGPQPSGARLRGSRAHGGPDCRSPPGRLGRCSRAGRWGAMPPPSGAVGEPGTTGGQRLGLSKQLLLSLCEQAEPPQWLPRVRWRAAPPRPAGSLRCPPAPQPWQGPRGSGQVRGAWALTRCVSELRQPQQEARGSHPAARRADSAALLLSLLGALPQHPAHPAALQAGPGRVQAGPGVRACLHPSAPGKFSLQPAGQISAKSGHHVAPGPQRRRGQLRQRAGQLHPGFRAGPGGQFTQAVFLLLCVVKKKLHLDTWAGWSSQCLQGWGPFFRLAVPSMLMTCIEWWAYEIGSFLMGRLSVLDLSAQAIIYEVATVVYMIPMGLSIAVCFRVGTALGAADTVQAKRSAVSGTLCTVGTSLVVGTLLSLLRSKLGHIFTNDEEVVALVSKVLPLYVVFHLFEAVCCLYGGVLRGTGRQAFGAVVNAVTYYVIGLPLGVVLTFVVGLGITGLWLGMLACVCLAAAAFVTYTACMDWKRAAEEVSAAPQNASGAPQRLPSWRRCGVCGAPSGYPPRPTKEISAARLPKARLKPTAQTRLNVGEPRGCWDLGRGDGSTLSPSSRKN
ncbi:multidrug and toxin extrusion protein 2 isoform X1 [Tursiops truncatus]|uniref:multidrug and toxin extrusion protein 2 isoform X1 n=1 Tax=Tursiops truncatus TaxID=9739 RepID=UPI003CCF0CAA